MPESKFSPETEAKISRARKNLDAYMKNSFHMDRALETAREDEVDTIIYKTYESFMLNSVYATWVINGGK